MRKMKHYCVGRNSTVLACIVSVLGMLVLLFKVYFEPEGISVSDIVDWVERLWSNYCGGIVLVVVVSVLIIVINGTPSSRFKKSIRKFKEQGILEDVIRDFEGSIFLFCKRKRKSIVRIGTLCLYYRSSGYILPYTDIVRARVHTYHTRYSSGRSDTFATYAEVLTEKKVYTLGNMKRDLLNPDWVKFQQILSMYAPHVVIDSIIETTEIYKYDKERRRPHPEPDD